VASGGVALVRHYVARCAIVDKMAPGKWWKFYQGGWNEPAIGGKASYVDACCVTYNRYLKKYVSTNYMSGMAFCNDLARQDWSPSVRPGDYWGTGGIWGFWAANAEKNDVYHCGEAMLVYSFWQKVAGRRFRVTLDKNGGADASLGVNSASFLNGADCPLSTDPGHYYGTPLLESSDSIEARRTRRVEWDSPEMKYSRNWSGPQAAAPGASMELTFQGSEVYWRAEKGPDKGKADVYLDGAFQATVDCWASAPMPLQFAFIKRGLDADKAHTIRVVVKNEKNPRSTGAVVRHLRFEYSAESYRASDCYSSVPGKNQWYNQQRSGGAYRDMTFQDPNWKGQGGCEIGYFHMVPSLCDAVRKWVAPRAGTVLVEGRAAPDGKGPAAVAVGILQGAKEIWPVQTVQQKPLLHSLHVAVAQGDALYFIAAKEEAIGGRVCWDPVVTYEEPTR
jgi:hypothetical protein